MLTRLRVAQWTTGKTGRAAGRAMVDHPAIEIVGCYAWSADKVGRDVGELCRIDPIGVSATDAIDALLALRPDCVVYAPPGVLNFGELPFVRRTHAVR